MIGIFKSNTFHTVSPGKNRSLKFLTAGCSLIVFLLIFSGIIVSVLAQPPGTEEGNDGGPGGGNQGATTGGDDGSNAHGQDSAGTGTGGAHGGGSPPPDGSTEDTDNTDSTYDPFGPEAPPDPEGEEGNGQWGQSDDTGAWTWSDYDDDDNGGGNDPDTTPPPPSILPTIVPEGSFIRVPQGSLNQVCCADPDHAIFDGLCLHSNGPYPVIGTPSIYAINNVWYDCDNTESICTNLCGLEWLPGGEYGPWPTALGEYDSPGGSYECCTDDRQGGSVPTTEYARSRRTGCLDPDSCIYANNWPEFGANSSDRVCCNDPDDAVFRGKCFEDKRDPNDPYDLVGGPYYYSSSGGGSIVAADGDTVPNIVANRNVWYDCDSDQATCEGSRSDGLCQLNWAKSGEYFKGADPIRGRPFAVACIGEHAQLPGTLQTTEPASNSSVKHECCGDDPVEVYVTSSQGLTGENRACCSIGTDCVDYDGDCITTCEHSQLNNGHVPNGQDYYCVLNKWWPKIYGKVTDVDGNGVNGALVTVVGAEHDGEKHGEMISFASGQYLMYVPDGTYDVLVSKPGDGYEDTIFFNVGIHEPVRVDFVLRRPSTDCNDDCTKSDGLCYADCHGKELCGFPEDPLRSYDLAALCDLSAPGVITLPDGRFFECCTGGGLRVPYRRIAADVDFCGENAVRSVRPVVLNGQLVNMVVTVFEKPSESCT